METTRKVITKEINTGSAKDSKAVHSDGVFEAQLIEHMKWFQRQIPSGRTFDMHNLDGYWPRVEAMQTCMEEHKVKNFFHVGFETNREFQRVAMAIIPTLNPATKYEAWKFWSQCLGEAVYHYPAQKSKSPNQPELN